MDWQSKLNEAQWEAVRSTEGPTLVLAGAGSGKTRVITYRIAYLIAERGIPPESILAVTFTNKASSEMADRVAELCSNSARQPFVSTFHKFGTSVLRGFGDRTDRGKDFVIYDDQDQMGLVKRCLKALNFSVEDMPPREVLSRISKAKDAFLTPELAALDGGKLFGAQKERHKAVVQVFRKYEDGLRQARAYDFDDLLMRTVELLRAHPDVLTHYQARFHYMLVDEFQDTNKTQYHLTRMLTRKHENLCAVGDEDQSIYRWRGADIQNILKFREDFPGAKLIKLEENYRSTDLILQAASALISNNRQRIGKTLWSARKDGAKIEYLACLSDLAEASLVVDKINEFAADTSYSDMAILYRTNAQSRVLEEALMRHSLPYIVVGGLRFYERKETKDITAYLRAILNPHDNASLLRVINTPPRGIGKRSIERLDVWAQSGGISLWEALENAIRSGELTPRESKGLGEFHSLLRHFITEAKDMTLPALLYEIIEKIGYEAYLDKSDPSHAEGKKENIEEMVSHAANYENSQPEPTLAGFLDQITLVSDADTLDSSRGVQLMTLHTAKGLEFSDVFLTGMEEDLFPHIRSQDSDEDMEEERRLCYVGMTRAKNRLVLSSSERRRVFGRETVHDPSRFLDEIPEEHLSAPIRKSGLWDDDDEKDTHYDEDDSDILFPDETVYSSDEEGWKEGMRIRHPKYGEGLIVRVDPAGNAGEKLTIRFPQGFKKIMTGFVELERL